MSATSVTELNDRARGWLRYLWEKATTPDDWSSTGEPHAWWDRDSTAPMCAFPRFDLGESAYSLPLMAQVTPAWREAYTRIAGEMCERHMTFWAAIDWLTLVGDDPNVDRLPPEWQVFVPERLRGRYPPPGWTGNGREPWGLAPDPLAADGNLFFRGFFNLLLGVYTAVSGDDRYSAPFEMSGYMDRTFTWTHPEIAEFISAQLAARPEGPHCENTKIWPFCVSAAGLGLKLYDAVHHTNLQSPFDAWTEFAQTHYMGRDRRGDLDWFALYYDPVEEEACTFPDALTAYASLCVTPYLLPQRPEWATWLYESSLRKLGWSDPRARINQFLPDPRFLSIALFMAHELGDSATEQRLRDFVEEDFEPRFFGEENTRFGYFFGWGEDHPRGQQSALLILPEVGGRGAWSAAFNDHAPARFDMPTVHSVDFPSLGISQARPENDDLLVSTYAATPSHAGRATTWRVDHLAAPADVTITCDGSDFTAWTVSGPDEIELRHPIGEHHFRIQGTRPGTPQPHTPRTRDVFPPGTTPSNITAAGPAATAIINSCRCC